MKVRNTTSRGKHLKGVIIEGGEEMEVDISPDELKKLKGKGLEAVREEKTVDKKKGD